MPDLSDSHLRERPIILYVATEDWYFHAHRLALAQGAACAGYEVVVATRVQQHASQLEAAGFRVISLPWRRRGGSVAGEVSTLFALWRLCRRLRPAMLHAIALKPIIYAGFAARLANVPVRIATVAGLGYVFTSQRLKARLLRPAVIAALAFAMGGRRSRVTLENPDDGKVLARANALDATQIAFVSSCGVDCDRFVPAAVATAGPVTVGMACRLVRDKGIDSVIAAVRQVRAAGVTIRFLLAGGVDPGNPDAHTEAEIQGWVDEGLVEWLGQIDDVAGFWHRCHVAVYPSRYGEGLPRTLLEAAASGLPIITADMPGCRDAIEAGVTGYLIAVDDVAALTARLIELASDPSLRQRMGAAGRRRTVEQFSDPVVVARFVALYDTLTSSNREAGGRSGS
jgi:glycosyltransferase involved in cell wall biosynthesis